MPRRTSGMYRNRFALQQGCCRSLARAMDAIACKGLFYKSILSYYYKILSLRLSKCRSVDVCRFSKMNRQSAVSFVGQRLMSSITDQGWLIYSITIIFIICDVQYFILYIIILYMISFDILCCAQDVSKSIIERLGTCKATAYTVRRCK